MKRHCSMCGLPGHDKRSHHKRNPAKRFPPLRLPKEQREKHSVFTGAKKPHKKNLDAYVAGGKIHPIRKSKGYAGFLAKGG